MDSFDLLPFSCVVNSKFLAVHGGISPDLKTVYKNFFSPFYLSKYLFLQQLDDLKKIDRFKEPPRSGIFCDILWADPVDNDLGTSE